MPQIGILFALVALVSWGLGDFFIQKTARIVGSWKALFFIGFLGFLVLFPFVKNDLGSLQIADILLLTLLGVVVIFAALFDFEALRQGKIAIVEPIIGLELPITVGLGVTLGTDKLTLPQTLLILTTFIGIVLAVTLHHTHLHYHKRLIEKGVILAGIGAIGLALTNFLVGFSSQTISPLMTIWFAHTLIAVVCGCYLVIKGELKSLIKDIRRNPKPIIGESIFDNLGWVAYAIATTTIPISIAITISESYIALAVLLGFVVNRERLQSHQIIGVIIAIVSVILLSSIAS